MSLSSLRMMVVYMVLEDRFSRLEWLHIEATAFLKSKSSVSQLPNSLGTTLINDHHHTTFKLASEEIAEKQRT